MSDPNWEKDTCIVRVSMDSNTHGDAQKAWAVILVMVLRLVGEVGQM
jgi:hypothetical protein